jgi:hypothetical protein
LTPARLIVGPAVAPASGSAIPSGDPDWYRVVYNLAVLRANRAARSPVTAWVDHQDAYRDALLVVLEAAGEAGRPRSRLTREGRRRRRFLRTDAEPSALVILAGLLAVDERLRTAAPARARVRTAGRRRLRRAAQRIGRTLVWPFAARARILTRLAAGRPPAPAAIVRNVERRRHLAARVHYNLACYHAAQANMVDLRAGTDADETERALDALERFTWRAEADELATTLPWARCDPTLAVLRQRRPEQFDAIVPPTGESVTPSPPAGDHAQTRPRPRPAEPR